MRSKETNCSFPSGDAAQAALFGAFLLNNFPMSFRILGGPVGSAQFVLAVSFSRVYYHCHYLGDTAFGMFTGLLVGQAMVKIGLKTMLKSIFIKFVGVGDDDIYSDM